MDRAIEETFRHIFVDKNKMKLSVLFESIEYEISEDELEYIFDIKKSIPFVLIEKIKGNRIEYRFNFRVKNAFYAPIFRSFFMEILMHELGIRGIT